MRTRLALCGLLTAFLLGAPAIADVIPMRRDLSPEQELLIGVWQEEKMAGLGRGAGHGGQQRTIAIANDTLAVLTFSGVRPSNDFDTSAMQGQWTATRMDDTTLKLSVTQSEGRGTTYILTFEGDDAFSLKDTERSPAARRFVRVPLSPRAAE